MYTIKRIGNIFLQIMIGGLPFGAAAQSIHITGGAQLVENGRIYMMLNNIGFVNDGQFQAGNGSVVEFIGSGIASVSGIGGSHVTSFSNLLVVKSAGDLLLSQDITVNAGLAISSGNLQLNGQTVNLGSSGQITRETEQSRILGAGGGQIVVSRSFAAGVAQNPGNIGAELLIPGPAGSNAGFYTIERRQAAVPLGGGLSSINRSYTVIAATNTPVTGQLRSFYLNSELNGLDASLLNLWASAGNGGVFSELGKDSNSITGKWVVKSGINLIGQFTLGPDGMIQSGRNLNKSKSMNPSDPAALTNGGITYSVKIYPNPTTGNVTISLYSKEVKKVWFSLYDQAGHLMQRKELNCAEGANNLSLNMSKYAAGIYFLSINNDGTNPIEIVKE